MDEHPDFDDMDRKGDAQIAGKKAAEWIEENTPTFANAYKWVYKHRIGLLTAVLIMSRVQRNSLLKDVAKLATNNKELVLENQAIKETVMNIRVIGNTDVDNLFEAYFGAKK